MSKKLIATLIFLLLVGFQMVFSATILYEYFDSTVFPPTDWDTLRTGTCTTWVRRTSSQIPEAHMVLPVVLIR